MAETDDVIWLTQEAYDALAKELNELKTVGRPEISAKIAAARDEGDLSENGGYHAAREEQGQMESRITQLESMLRRAQVGDAPADTSTVSPGSVVTIAFFGDEDDTETFLLGSREMLGMDDSIKTTVYSPQSPLGASVNGRQVGETVSYVAPNGKTIEVTIIKVA